MKALFSWISTTIFRMGNTAEDGSTAEDGNSAEYFEKLFGNATEGRLSLFSDENPFHRKQNEGFGAHLDGTSHYGRNETDTEKYETVEENKNKIQNDNGNKKLGQVKSSANDVVADSNGNSDCTDRKKKKMKESENTRKEKLVRGFEEAFTNNDSLPSKKKKMNKARSIRIEEIVGGIEEACTDNDSLPRKKKKMKEAGSGMMEEIVRGIEEACTNNDSLPRKKKKMKEAKNIKAENDEELGIRKEEVVRGIEEACTGKDEFTRKKKKKKMNEFVEGSSVGDGIIGLSEEGRTNLRFKAEAEDGNHGLGTKRKDDELDDVALSRIKKKRRIATEGESHILEEKVKTTNNRKRALEHDNSQPSKRVKIHPRYCDGFEVLAGPGSLMDSKLEVKSDTEVTDKVQLRKRKRDAIEEEYEARHDFGDGETLSKEGGGPKKVTGKRKWGDEAADMVVKKDSFDDGEKLERTVFVGNLPSEVKRKKLTREFSQFGEVESVRLRSIPILDTKLPRKGAVLTGRINESINSVHAYIVFKDAQSANAALSYNMAEIGGNHIRVDRAHPPCKKLKGENHCIYDIKRTIFLGNLPFDVMDEEVYQLFAGFEQLESTVEAIRVVRDSQTSMGKGIAYVLFKTQDAAKLAVKNKNLKVRDRSLRVTMARPNSNTPQQREPNSRLKSTPITKSSGRKRWPALEETSNITLVKKTKTSLSYQGTKASKTVNHSTKLTGTTSMSNQQDNEPKPRVFKRPAVAAKKASSSKSPGQNPSGIKRKWEGKRTGYSKSPKRIRVG